MLDRKGFHVCDGDRWGCWGGCGDVVNGCQWLFWLFFFLAFVCISVGLGGLYRVGIGYMAYKDIMHLGLALEP